MLILVTAPALAQYQITSLDELRRELAVGDLVTIVQANGDSAKGRLLRVGDGTLDIQPDARRSRLTIPINTLVSVDRRGDSLQNGTLIGAAIGAAPVVAMFIYAMAVDRNEIDEWAPIYLGLATGTAVTGALVGRAIDAAHSRPRLTLTISF